MKLTGFSLLSSVALGLAAVTGNKELAERDGTSIGVQAACAIFKLAYNKQTFFPNSANYTAENDHYSSGANWLGPACVFVPSSAQDVAYAVGILTITRAQFAVRGGGHMPIPGYANTATGVLVALTNLNSMTLSSDKKTVSVGPGNRWQDVYSFLNPYGLVALGGRVGTVGVPGLLLGGGISFYSNQYGFAANSVINYQVVLATGQIVQASATGQYSDLFWALKGGGNSFGIVTRFDLQTYSSPSVCAGIIEVDSSEKVPFLNAVANFGLYGSQDSKAAVIPSIFMLASLGETIYTSALFYDGPNCNQPALANFTALPTIANSYTQTTLATYILETDAYISDGTRQEFQVISSLVSAQSLQIVHDTFVQMVTDDIYTVAGLQASVAFQPVTKNFILAGNAKGGNPQGVDPSKAPYFWMVENFSWTNASDDAKIYAFATNVTAAIDAKLDAIGQKAQYHYMNDAGKGQPIFQNYPPANLARLQQIRAKYDPFSTFVNLETGGWKLP